MPDIADKPFLSVLAEEPTWNPASGPLTNLGQNLARGADKVLTRNTYRDRARQMNLALDQWRRDQAVLRRRVMTKTAIGLGGLGESLGRMGESLGPRWEGGMRRLKSPAGQTMLGALGGAGLTAGELATGYADPNMNWRGGKTGLLLGNMVLGGTMGNPYARQWLWRTTEARGRLPVVPEGEPTMAQVPLGNSYHPFRALGIGAATTAMPRLASFGDTSYKLTKQLSDKMVSDPNYFQPIVDPAAYGKDVASNAVKQVVGSPTAQVFGGALGNSLAGGVGGALVGGAAGKILGNLTASDDPSLSYEARRRRERLRSLLGWGGTIAGGVAAPWLLSKYAPNLIPNAIQDATGQPRFPAR
jgi:hypothetical protein